MRGLEKRYLFKRAFRGLLPAETLAKRKHGFGVPVSEWLRTHRGFRELAQDTLWSSNARVMRYLTREGLDGLARLHASDATSYYGSLLWRLLMLELWQPPGRGARGVRTGRPPCFAGPRAPSARGPPVGAPGSGLGCACAGRPFRCSCSTG